MVPKGPEKSVPISAISWHRYSKSVILGSFATRLPGAEGTTMRRRGSLRTMDSTFRSWEASATLVPPNLQTMGFMGVLKVGPAIYAVSSGLATVATKVPLLINSATFERRGLALDWDLTS